MHVQASEVPDLKYQYPLSLWTIVNSGRIECYFSYIFILSIAHSKEFNIAVKKYCKL